MLIVDSVFGMRPEYDDHWDFRIWIEVPRELALARGIERDATLEGRDEAERLHRDRYHVAEQIYVTEVDPKAKADVIIDNTDCTHPVVIRWRPASYRLECRNAEVPIAQRPTAQ
ncbi:MAG: hypothetical protein WDA60_04790 [Acidimicrobiia bacterium]